MASNEKFVLNTYDDQPNVAYLMLPSHPGKGSRGVVKKTVSLSALIEGYSGAEINLDFDENNELIGLEILG